MRKTKRKTPKGKIASKAKGTVNEFEKRVSELDSKVPFRTCYICERESRDLQMVGVGRFRCPGCYPGSSNWMDMVERLSISKRTEEQTLLYNANAAKRKL